MSRKLRLEYPGAMYHVMSRGDQREDIFRDDADREKFLSTLGEACVKTEWQNKCQSSLLTLPGRADKGLPCRASYALRILGPCITS
jgi:hypothetical protein